MASTPMTETKIRDAFLEFRDRLTTVEERLRTAQLSPAILASRSFLDDMLELDAIVRDPSYESLSDEVMRSPYFQTKGATLRNIYEFYEVFMETQGCLEILYKQKDLTQLSDLVQRTFDGAKVEGERAGCSAESRVAFVGSGPFPETAIAYALTFGCEVTCIDSNPEAVVLASHLIQHLGLAGKIHQRYMQGETFDYSAFTHVVVAALARPKDRILKRICETSRDAVVVCRTVSGLRSFIYESANDLAFEHFDLVDKIVTPRTFHHSLILAKRAHPTH